MTEHPHTTGPFSCMIEGEIATIRMNKPVVDFAVHLGAKHDFFSLLTQIEQSSDVGALVLIHSQDALSDETYRRFFERVMGTAQSHSKDSSPETDLAREENALRQYILRASTFRKMLVSCLRGRVAAPLFGAHLASDIRIVSEDFVIEMSHIALGIPPDGALGFFLPRFVGQGRATELLLSGESVTALQALDLGLVHSVLSGDDFEKNCVKTARRYVRLPPKTMPFTKDVLRPSKGELERYLDREVSAILRCLKMGCV